MKKTMVAAAILIGIFVLFFGAITIYFMNLDFVGHKDPETVKRNVEARKRELLSARYFSATEVCEITLRDNTNIMLYVGDHGVDHLVFRQYYISGDTIIIKKEPNEVKEERDEMEKYINSGKMLIKNDKVLFHINENKQFDTLKAMQIKFNKIISK
ncbi:hypothetical protein [Flavobacterium sp. ov086]|uniref:hypothetical protein n=1 Tax=Flavobacterium sp. ov086 TaxID=1761785 RepID=UPI000B6C4151|nr:hypothetical protein [Flavobacterium sp. ov086]SNR29422.1 hypothetical protein SAMN04487979_10216 [Flavobacterium sp. ov086]